MTIKGVTGDYQAFSLNTVLAKLMELNNHLMRLEQVPRAVLPAFLTMLSPQAPHFADEMGAQLGLVDLVSETLFPKWDEGKTITDQTTVVVQVNGKLRDKLTVPRDASQEELEAMALASEKVRVFTDGKAIRRVIVVPNKSVNLVVG